MTKYREIFERLAADFAEGEVKWKPGQGKKEMPFVNARVVMNRLDTVLGPENWWDRYEEHENSVVCYLSIEFPDGKVITKSDAGGFAGMADQGDDAKSGYSDAFKRAAVKFGVGRLLYGSGTPDFGGDEPHTPPPRERQALPPGLAREAHKAPPSEEPIPDATPMLPSTKGQKLAAWAKRQGHEGRASALARANYKCRVEELADDQADALYKLIQQAKPVEPKEREPQGSKNENGNPVKFGWPKHGGALYAWAKTLEGAFNTSIISCIDDNFGPKSSHKFPRSYKEWDETQVELAAIFVARWVKTFPGYDGQFDAKIPDVAQLKLDLAEAARQICGHQGNREPSYAAINEVLRQHSSALDDHDGEVIDDIDQCDNEALIKATMASVMKDLREMSNFEE